MTSFTALPPIADSALPREIREGTPADKRAYKAALGFEQMLVGELVREMTATTPALSEGPRGDAVTDALTESLVAAGGLGLAPQLYAAMRKEQP